MGTWGTQGHDSVCGGTGMLVCTVGMGDTGDTAPSVMAQGHQHVPWGRGTWPWGGNTPVPMAEWGHGCVPQGHSWGHSGVGRCLCPTVSPVSPWQTETPQGSTELVSSLLECPHSTATNSCHCCQNGGFFSWNHWHHGCPLGCPLVTTAFPSSTRLSPHHHCCHHHGCPFVTTSCQ